MSLSDLASLGSFVSGVAVVVTLIFLVLQMRQANRYQRASMQLGRAARNEYSAVRATNPEIARISVKALSCAEPLDEVEARLWLTNVWADFRNAEDTFLQHRAGLLEGASQASDEALMRVFLASPAYRVMWQFISITFSEEFRAYVDGVIGQVGLLPGYEIANIYNQAVREQVAQVNTPTPNPTDLSSAISIVRGATKLGKEH